MHPDQPDGATPLDEDALAGLIPNLTTQAELNEFEAANIAQAHRWLRGRGGARIRRNILDLDSLLTLHRRMFDQTWRWAGQVRDRATNIGVDHWQIRPALVDLCRDAYFQIAHATYPVDELATRFHHRLVSIHPFLNGNGRHARLAADLLAEQLGRPAFTWGGSGSLVAAGSARTRYLEALRAADSGDLDPLLAFVRN